MKQSDKVDNINDITATELVSRIRIGWCLGNTLEAHKGLNGFPWLGGGVYANTTVAELETAWGNPITTKDNIDAVYNAGFNAIRIPVTWFKVADSKLNIREDWMFRVAEIVDYAMSNDMYVFLDTHHEEYIFKLDNLNIEESKRSLVRIWEQIAYTFKNYNERLIFEGLSEPRTLGGLAEWSGGTEEEHNNLNILNQIFVDTIRNTGGNNARRVIMIPTYAASSVEIAQRALIIPTDIVANKIIVSLHIYNPWYFALSTNHRATDIWDKNNPEDTRPIITPLDLAHDLFVKRGIPVIISETGAIDRNNDESRAKWSEFFILQAYKRGIPCFWWDSGTFEATKPYGSSGNQVLGLLNRRTSQFAHPKIIDALMLHLPNK